MLIVFQRTKIPTDEFEITGETATAVRVKDNLWIGSAPPIGAPIGDWFDCLVLCAKEYQIPECFDGIQVAQAMLDDNGSPMTQNERLSAIQTSSKVIEWLSQGKQVLVTCRQGRNRSGLICALALACGPEKMSAEKAIATVKLARNGMALQNPFFIKFIDEFCNYHTLNDVNLTTSP
jgi:protein-tyrosine phosphatase